MWWLSGIQRDVVLYSKPHELFIWDYKVTTDVDRSLTASLLTLEVRGLAAFVCVRSRALGGGNRD